MIELLSLSRCHICRLSLHSLISFQIAFIFIKGVMFDKKLDQIFIPSLIPIFDNLLSSFRTQKAGIHALTHNGSFGKSLGFHKREDKHLFSLLRRTGECESVIRVNSLFFALQEGISKYRLSLSRSFGREYKSIRALSLALRARERDRYLC